MPAVLLAQALLELFARQAGVEEQQLALCRACPSDSAPRSPPTVVKIGPAPA
jgi:hypothetical protein